MRKDIVFISKNKDGNYYIGFKTKVKRGIHGKEVHANELIIVGMNKNKFQEFCEKHNIEVDYEI